MPWARMGWYQSLFKLGWLKGKHLNKILIKIKIKEWVRSNDKTTHLDMKHLRWTTRLQVRVEMYLSFQMPEMGVLRNTLRWYPPSSRSDFMMNRFAKQATIRILGYRDIGCEHWRKRVLFIFYHCEMTHAANQFHIRNIRTWEWSKSFEIIAWQDEVARYGSPTSVGQL